MKRATPGSSDGLPPAPCLAVFGTGSDVGKSVLTAALCRLFRRSGVDVAPFKAQNMANNSYVTADGLEMGRAQVVQAEAARVEPAVDMNPVLLKPSSDTGAQVVVHGRPVGNCLAKDYFHDTTLLSAKAEASLNRLRQRHRFVILEGAGSCAEVNLRDRDFVNFRMAHACDAPVILVGDIDKGGIFAQLVGTLDVLPEEDRRRIRGFIVNRFRGDPALFQDGIEWLERRTGLPVLGLIPWFYHIDIDSEDGIPLDVVVDPPGGPVTGRINIGVLRLPHISNFTDFSPLAREAVVNLHYLARPRSLAGYDLLILPGSKNVRGDLEWLRAEGWEDPLREYAAGAGRILGICGGYQMLGREIRDPLGLEGDPGSTAGLGLVPVQTELLGEKTLTRTRGEAAHLRADVDGYEIHMGTTAPIGAGLPPLLRITSRNGVACDEPEGVRSADGRLAGTYLHGLFDEPGFRHEYLAELAPPLADRLDGRSKESIREFKNRQYDLLADHIAEHLDLTALAGIAGLPAGSLR